MKFLYYLACMSDQPAGGSIRKGFSATDFIGNITSLGAGHVAGNFFSKFVLKK